jgi:hypothetical protein
MNTTLRVAFPFEPHSASFPIHHAEMAGSSGLLIVHLPRKARPRFRLWKEFYKYATTIHYFGLSRSDLRFDRLWQLIDFAAPSQAQL